MTLVAVLEGGRLVPDTGCVWTSSTAAHVTVFLSGGGVWVATSSSGRTSARPFDAIANAATIAPNASAKCIRCIVFEYTKHKIHSPQPGAIASNAAETDGAETVEPAETDLDGAWAAAGQRPERRTDRV